MSVNHATSWISYPTLFAMITVEEALARVKAAAGRNQKVHVETCVQYLLLDESLYFQEGFEGAKVVMSPPLRKAKDQEALWAALRVVFSQSRAEHDDPRQRHPNENSRGG